MNAPLDRSPRPRLPFAALGLLLLLVVVALELHLVEIAYEKLGVDAHTAAALLVASLLGSRVNVPLGRVRDAPTIIDGFVTPGARTWIAVNVGGAVIPIGVSAYLLVTHGVVLEPSIVTVVVATVVHWLARPVPGVGIVVPTFVPPFLAAGAALAFAPDEAAVVAYVGGTLGTLIGADLLNLRGLAGLGAPVASIGGAGTFDGIFITGILAVLLA